MNTQIGKKALPRPEKPSGNALFLLRYLATLEPNTRFDSRLLYRQLGTSAKKAHDLWVHFIAAYHTFIEKFVQAVEERMTADRDGFHMLTPVQASLAIVYDRALKNRLSMHGILINMKSSFTPLKPVRNYILQTVTHILGEKKWESFLLWT